MGVLDGLLSIGLLVELADGPQTAAGQAALKIDLEGTARFIVRGDDIGPERGLELMARGLVFVLRAETGAVHPAGRANPATSTRTTPQPEPGGPPSIETMPVKHARSSLERLVDRVQGGVQVALTDGGQRRAVLVGWSSYAQLQRRLALAAAADWAAWRSGKFDTARYAADMQAAGMGPTGEGHPVPGGPTLPTHGGGEPSD